MKLIVYGTDLCPDCVEAHRLLKEADIPYEYRDFSTGMLPLKEFLVIRDDPEHAALFDPVRAKGGVGIPCFVIEGVEVTLDVQRVLELARL